MGTEVQVKTHRHIRKNAILISLAVFSLIMLAAAAQFTYMTLKNDRVYKGIFINNLNAGGMSRQEMAERLKSQFQDKLSGPRVTLKTDRTTLTSGLTDLKAAYNIDEAADRAYSIGRTGNIFDRIYDIFIAGSRTITVNMPISYSKEDVAGFIDDFYNKTLIEVKEADVLIRDDRVTIHSGRHGENIDKKNIQAQVEDMIKEGRGGTITSAIIITPPDRLNIDDLYSEINREPKDASFVVANGNTTVVPHVAGRKIDKATLADIADKLEKTEDATMVLPVEYINPKITTEAANANMYRDELSTMSTRFSVSTVNDKNRGENIKLAASKINGVILLPGEVFSFNGAVGPRTAEGGYLPAHTYTAGKIVDGIGGGICQVSTTLYNAVLKADLEVVERRNHMFTVGYVPFGQDATVSYGTTDFKFRNSTGWPVRIEAGVTKNNSVFFTLTGTNETPDKKVLITNQILKTTPFTVKYIDDPTLSEGKTAVKQEGKEGYVVDTFKTVKIGTKVISQEKLYTSTYHPLVQEVLKGTKKDTKPGQPSQGTDDAGNPPAPQDQPSPGVDDADNPPAP